jgi:hypothetical protein
MVREAASNDAPSLIETPCMSNMHLIRFVFKLF